MTNSRNTVLVAGGAGYIGSHACKALSRAGYLPVTYDNLIYGHDWAVKWGPFEHGDILDRGRLDEVLSRHQPEAVMHFAAFTYVGKSVSDPGKYYRNNVVGSLTLLEAARDHGIRRFVFSSTAAVYGIPASVPILEDAISFRSSLTRLLGGYRISPSSAQITQRPTEPASATTFTFLTWRMRM